MPGFGSDEKRELFERYIQVCNKALHLNGGRFPFKQILDEASRFLSDNQSVEVLIVDDRPKEGFGISFDRESRAVLAEGVGRSCYQKRWKVLRSYLQDVVDNPSDYINNPAKIDWAWLQDFVLDSSDYPSQDEQSKS